MDDKSFKGDALTVSSRAVEIQDIALWIYFLIEGNRDSASFSAIRRNVYNTILEYRLKNPVVHADRSHSFALLLQRDSNALRSCTSLKITEFPSEHLETLLSIFDVNKAFSVFCNAAILKAAGEDGNLKHFSGNIQGWFPETQVHKKNLAHQIRRRRHLDAQFADVKASNEEFKSTRETLDLMADRLVTDLSKRLSDSGVRGNVDEFKTTSSVLDELQKSAASLEELHINFTTEAWSSLCSGSFPALRRLGLVTTGSTTNICIGLQVPLLVQPIPLNAFEALEALKISVHGHESPTQLLIIRCPQLKLFEIGGFGGNGGDLQSSLSAIRTFIESHPTLEAISLANHFVTSTVKGPQNLLAVHYSYSKHASIPKLPISIRLPSIRQARVEFSSVALFFAEMPSKKDVSHVRCLELCFRSRADCKYMLDGSADSDVDSDSEFNYGRNPTPLISRVSEINSVFSNLVELGIHLHLPYEFDFDVMSKSAIICQILAGCRDCKSILAVRLRVTCTHDAVANGAGDSFDISAAPPNLRFVCLDAAAEGKGELYDVKAQADRVGRIATRRSLRKKLPAEGKWTVDFTDESIFNHLTGDYSNPQC